jgi:hypothetical protein
MTYFMPNIDDEIERHRRQVQEPIRVLPPEDMIGVSEEELAGVPDEIEEERVCPDQSKFKVRDQASKLREQCSLGLEHAIRTGMGKVEG